MTYDPKLLALADQLNLKNTVRRTIFCTIMSGSDYLDSYYKLANLSFKNKKDEREIIRVTLVACGAETVYNPYYTLLATRLCEEKSHRYSFQYALWDNLRELNTFPVRKVYNLAKLVAGVLESSRVHLGVLKFLELPPREPNANLFLTTLFESLFLMIEGDLVTIFSKIARNSELLKFCKGIQKFIRANFLKKPRAGYLAQIDKKELKGKVNEALRAMLTEDELL